MCLAFPATIFLQLYKLIDESPIKLVGVTREDNAGFAADAYARIHGLGCICVTYCVGGLSTCNSIAGAYAEKSPVIVLAGSPGMSERAHNPLLHHKVKGFETQFEVFQKITVASAVLDRPETAFGEIDRVLAAAVRYKRPVYLELPRDQVEARQITPHRPPEGLPPSDPDALREAIEEAAALLTAARRPVILADVEIHRFGLQNELLTLAESTGMPIATTLLGKSVISEAHPLFGGVYEGAMGQPEVTELVESADCLLMLGCFLTDINLGIWTAKLDPSRCIDATSEDLRIKRHHYRRRPARRLHPRPDRSQTQGRENPRTDAIPTVLQAARAPAGERLTSARLFGRLNQMLAESTDDMTVIADIGDSLFGAADLEMHRHTEFLSPAYYTSMGFGVPAAVGRQHGEPEVADSGDRRRRCFPDDRHGAVDDRTARAQPDRRDLEQPWLHDRAILAGGSIQRYPELGVSQSPGRSGSRHWPGSEDGRRSRRGTQGGAGQHRELQSDQRSSRSVRPQPLARTTGPATLENRDVFVTRRPMSPPAMVRSKCRNGAHLHNRTVEKSSASDFLDPFAVTAAIISGAGCRRTLRASTAWVQRR